MILTNQMIEMAKEIAWQQADHYIHLESDGAQIEDYVFLLKNREIVLNPWENETDPFVFYGEQKMVLFCVKLLARNAFDCLLNPQTPDGWIYIGDDLSERYVLGQPGRKNLICMGINPSKARPLCVDNTTSIVQKTAEHDGYDGWIIINLYPSRATNPQDLPKESSAALEEMNFAIVNAVLEKYCDSTIWAAWGSSIEKRKYLPHILKKYGVSWSKYKWICKGGILKYQHPHHPLRIAGSEAFVDFDIVNYMSTLR